MIVSSDIDPSTNALHCLVLIPQTGAGGLKLRRSVFICQENIHALLSRVSSASVSDYLSACLCYVHSSVASEMVVFGFHKIFIYT